MQKINRVNVKEMNFDQLFKEISPNEIYDNVFKLVGKDFSVITAGKEEHHNSMVSSGGGWFWGAYEKTYHLEYSSSRPLYA